MISIANFYKNFISKLFSRAYLNRQDAAKYLYLRILFIRAWLFDMPLAIALSLWVIPWETLYHYSLVEELIDVMESISPNIVGNRKYSEFPEFAVTFLSIIHFFGILSLILPFIYSFPTDTFRKKIKEKGYKFGLKMTTYSLLMVALFLYGHLTIGAISYFGCQECSYNHKLSLVVGAFLVWLFIHHALAGGLLILKATNDLRQKGEI